jgi:hypothetical protein
MAVRRVPHEGARWWSAVLIVAAIAAVAAGLRHVSVTPPTPPLLVSRPLPLPMPPVAAPPLGVSDRTDARPTPRATPVDPGRKPDPAVDPGAAPAAVVRPAASTISPPADIVLASHRFDAGLTVAPPPLVVRPPGVSAPPASARDGASLVASDPASRGLIEMPAVALTRAVSVAGKGIRTGLRATTAVFRAAF